MTTVATQLRAITGEPIAVWVFGAALIAVGIVSCLLAGWAPIGFSIATVFLFAGPHNWIEARYFMQKMPARWGKLRVYYLIGIGGILLLATSSLLLPSVARLMSWRTGEWSLGIAGWNTLLMLWILVLVQMRQSETRRLNWTWMWPVGFVLIALNWLWPISWSLALVYLHPLVALWFLDRELGRRRSSWQPVYRKCLMGVPVLLGLLWWRLADSGNLPGEDFLSMQIAHHAGANIWKDVSSHLLVSTHTFLETLHYGVWLLAIPLVALRAAPWKLERIPLSTKSTAWRYSLVAILVLGLLITVFLWLGFIANYPLTRDIYFSVAILHVLAEVPFILRML